ncbi:MAG: DNA polymerase III subunit delta [Gammaproteobacteria bacterium]|nr:DNA polymerase III subunit delta [Gammaproteobacteria bacterium]
MQVFSNQLAEVLKEGLKPVYVTGGSEAVLEEEASREILETAQTAGIEDHEIHRLDSGSSRGRAKAMEWGGIFDELSESSLFGTRKLVEVRMRTAAFDDGAVAAFETYSAEPASNVLLVRLAGLDYRDKRKKWYGQLRSSKNVVFIVVDELNREHSIHWLQSKATSLGLKLTKQAAEKLSDYSEGNLLAARQELDKFQIILDEGATVDVDDIDLADASNAEMLEVIDAVFSGNAAQISRKLDGLSNQGRSSSRHELGTLAMVTQVLTLAHAKLMDSGSTIPGYQRRRVDALISRHGQAGVEKLLMECAQFNSMFLGMARGDAANLLRNLLFAIAGVQGSNLENEYEWRVIDRTIN